MVRRRLLLLLIAALLLPGRGIHAAEKEPTAIVERDGAGERGLPGASSFGPAAAVEFTPIQDWLEIETGVAPMFSDGSSEWDTDVLFKKPFTLFGAAVRYALQADGRAWRGDAEGEGRLTPRCESHGRLVGGD